MDTVDIARITIDKVYIDAIDKEDIARKTIHKVYIDAMDKVDKIIFSSSQK